VVVFWLRPGVIDGVWPRTHRVIVSGSYLADIPRLRLMPIYINCRFAVGRKGFHMFGAALASAWWPSRWIAETIGIQRSNAISLATAMVPWKSDKVSVEGWNIV
jgi:hypothetical protein